MPSTDSAGAVLSSEATNHTCTALTHRWSQASLRTVISPFLPDRYPSATAYPVQGGPDAGSGNPCERGIREGSRAS